MSSRCATLAVACALAVLTSPGLAAEPLDPRGAIGCVATHMFSCDPEGCTHESEPSSGSVRLYIDLRTGAGQLCEYTQCRGLVASFSGEDAGRTAQVVFGPSSNVLNRSAAGETIGEAELQPSPGGTLGVDRPAATFLLSQMTGTTLSGYSGTCEAADSP
jgi:hypothetical protein